MTEINLSAAVEAMLTRYEAIPSSCEHWDRSLDEYPDMCRACEYRLVLDAAVPFIEEQVRERASQELRAWAEEIKDPGITGPRAIRRRTLMSAASKILPKLTPAELAQKIASGDAYIIHCTALDIEPERFTDG